MGRQFRKDVFFTTTNPIRKTLEDILSEAAEEIRIAVFNIDLGCFEKQLLEVQKRGVKLYCIFDRKSLNKDNTHVMVKLGKLGGVIRIFDSEQILFHPKIAIVDDTLIASSGNWREPHFSSTRDHWLITTDRLLCDKAKLWFDNSAWRFQGSRPLESLLKVRSKRRRLLKSLVATSIFVNVMLFVGMKGFPQS